MTTLDLRTLDLVHGGGAHVLVPVEVADLRLAGQPYRAVPAAPDVRVDASRSGSGLALRLRTAVEMVGPCWRCLEEARARLKVDTREFQAAGRPPDAEFDEDLDSAYVDREQVDLATWLRDAVADALPPVILCRESCAGLCPTCGADLNAGACACPPPAPDPRWAALGPLAERLRRQQ